MEKLLTVKETAQLLSIASSTLYKAISSRKVPHLKIGSKVLFSPEAIRGWLDELQRVPIPGQSLSTKSLTVVARDTKAES